MILQKSRIKYKEAIKKIVPKEIGLPNAIPYGRLVLFHQPPGSQYIIIYEPQTYMEDLGKVHLPKWLLTPECLDKRYKPKSVTVDGNIAEELRTKL